MNSAGIPAPAGDVKVGTERSDEPQPNATPTLPQVLGEVEGRVGYLRALATVPDGSDWTHCDTLGADVVAAAVEAGATARGGIDGQVAASLLAQSYAFRVGAVSLAAYAVGLPWPIPAADAVAVRFAKGRAAGLSFRTDALGDPEAPGDLADALLGRHLAGFATVLRRTTRVGQRLLWGNAAASCAAAFRAVEGAARDRGDVGERALIRERAAQFFTTAAPWLDRTGRFERVEAAGVDGWFWTRTSCCLWYQVPGTSTCDDCSLIPADELAARRCAELEGGAR